MNKENITYFINEANYEKSQKELDKKYFFRSIEHGGGIRYTEVRWMLLSNHSQSLNYIVATTLILRDALLLLHNAGLSENGQAVLRIMPYVDYDEIKIGTFLTNDFYSLTNTWANIWDLSTEPPTLVNPKDWSYEG